MHHQEFEFLAENEKVGIIPNFSSSTPSSVNTSIFENIVPFRAQNCTIIPLWQALSLKKRGKCSVLMPKWMKVENLVKILKEERLEKKLKVLPFHYIEIAHSLCKHAREDIYEWNRVFDLVESIRSVRMNKIQYELRQNNLGDKRLIENISALEISFVKPLLFCSKVALFMLQNDY